MHQDRLGLMDENFRHATLGLNIHPNQADVVLRMGAEIGFYSAHHLGLTGGGDQRQGLPTAGFEAARAGMFCADATALAQDAAHLSFDIATATLATAILIAAAAVADASAAGQGRGSLRRINGTIRAQVPSAW